jgi:hypothetical protein
MVEVTEGRISLEMPEIPGADVLQSDVTGCGESWN